MQDLGRREALWDFGIRLTGHIRFLRGFSWQKGFRLVPTNGLGRRCLILVSEIISNCSMYIQEIVIITKIIHPSSFTHIYHASDAVASFHVLKCGIDMVQWLPMCNELVDFQLAGHVVIHEVWQLRATFDATESTAFPHTSGNQLER